MKLSIREWNDILKDYYEQSTIKKYHSQHSGEHQALYEIQKKGLIKKYNKAKIISDRKLNNANQKLHGKIQELSMEKFGELLKESSNNDNQQKIVDNFVHYGSFLGEWVAPLFFEDGSLPLAHSKEDYIEDINKIINWIYNYSYSPLLMEYNDKIIRPKKPKNNIQKDIKLIQDFREFVNEISYKNIEINNEVVDLEIPILSQTKEFLDLLEDDLNSKTFELVPKSKYYNLKLVSKADLKTLLLEIKEKYNLKYTTLSIENLIMEIVTTENLSEDIKEFNLAREHIHVLPLLFDFTHK